MRLIKIRYVRVSGFHFAFHSRPTNLHKHDYLLNIFSLEIESRSLLAFFQKFIIGIKIFVSGFKWKFYFVGDNFFKCNDRTTLKIFVTSRQLSGLKQSRHVIYEHIDTFANLEYFVGGSTVKPVFDIRDL